MREDTVREWSGAICVCECGQFVDKGTLPNYNACLFCRKGEAPRQIGVAIKLKKHQLASFDFVRAADALTNESFHGDAHLAICEGIAEMDPFVGNYAPVFFMYTFYGNLYSAQMHANKLFDTHRNAVTVPKFLEMARLQSSKFQHANQTEVRSRVAEAESVIKRLTPTIKVLRNRRNDFLAHISPKLAFTPEQLQHTTKLTVPQIREVLYEGGKIANQILIMWNKSTNQLREPHADDYKKIVSLASKQLCSEIKAHEAKYNDRSLLPSQRPRGCT